ncbi:hypothetical protein ACIBM4_20365 [Streptomyces sp. NPDC050256]|uniref:hypothetical protein n=1 Tax=unclassified Streptomyces TaxID=2593676 RepID=UPI0037A05086
MLQPHEDGRGVPLKIADGDPGVVAVRLAWDWAMSGVVVEPVTQSVAEEATHLFRSTGLHGDQYAIAAVLAVVAGRQRGRAVVFTSDADGVGKLCGAGVRVRGL